MVNKAQVVAAGLMLKHSLVLGTITKASHALSTPMPTWKRSSSSEGLLMNRELEGKGATKKHSSSGSPMRTNPSQVPEHPAALQKTMMGSV